MITVHHHDFGVTIRVDGVVGETDFVSLTGGVDDVLVVQVEEEGAHGFVVNFTTSLRLVLGDEFTAVLADERVLWYGGLDEDTPT